MSNKNNEVIFSIKDLEAIAEIKNKYYQSIQNLKREISINETSMFHLKRQKEALDEELKSDEAVLMKLQSVFDEIKILLDE